MFDHQQRTAVRGRIDLLLAVVAMSGLTMATPSLSQHAPKVDIVKHGELDTIVTTTFKAPREAVFRAFTSCEAIKTWMKPEHMTLTDCSIDARVGGTLKLVFLASKDRRIEVRDTYRTIDAPRLIQYEESYDFSPLEISVTATLETLGDATQFKETLVYRSKQERDTDFPGIAESLPGAYAKLDQYLQAQ